MEIRQLKTLITVAEKLSFTRAAETLHLAQSSVSAQIKSLEQELDLKVFDRIGRRVQLTEAGRKLVAYARKMDEMTREIQSEFSADRYARGALTIRVPETIAAIYLPEVACRFHARHPGVALDFINCTDQQLREELNSGRIDLAFLLTDAVTFKQVNVKLLKTEELALISGPGHPFAGRAEICLADLEGQTILRPRTD